LATIERANPFEIVMSETVKIKNTDWRILIGMRNQLPKLNKD
jgi:hypothetical protein